MMREVRSVQFAALSTVVSNKHFTYLRRRLLASSTQFSIRPLKLHWPWFTSTKNVVPKLGSKSSPNIIHHHSVDNTVECCEVLRSISISGVVMMSGFWMHRRVEWQCAVAISRILKPKFTFNKQHPLRIAYLGRQIKECHCHRNCQNNRLQVATQTSLKEKVKNKVSLFNLK